MIRIQARDPMISPCFPCRDVTPDEVRAYQSDGWVKLSGFVDRDLIASIRLEAERRMGTDGDGNAPFGTNTLFFNAEPGPGLCDPGFRALLDRLGDAARALMARRSGAGVRYFIDHFAPKLPVASRSRNAGNGPTNYHQDFVAHAVDRSGGMTFWIPLDAYGPEAGTMSFLSRSHRFGVVGNYANYGGADLRDVYPELRELTETPPIRYAPGDVTVHDTLTVHGAGPNRLDTPRWAYMVLVQPEDAHWTGAPPEAFDPTGMFPNQPLPDTLFPRLGTVPSAERG